MNCLNCENKSGYSLLCKACIKVAPKSVKNKALKAWHERICEGSSQCFHCEKWFPRDMLCGDHLITRASMPSLKYDIRVGRRSCASCNTSGNQNRKPVPQEILDIIRENYEKKL